MLLPTYYCSFPVTATTCTRPGCVHVVRQSCMLVTMNHDASDNNGRSPRWRDEQTAAPQFVTLRLSTVADRSNHPCHVLATRAHFCLPCTTFTTPYMQGLRSESFGTPIGRFCCPLARWQLPGSSSRNHISTLDKTPYFYGFCYFHISTCAASRIEQSWAYTQLEEHHDFHFRPPTKT